MIEKRVITRAIKAWTKAKETLKGRNVWIQGVEAKDKDGKWVDPRSKKAVQFCADGALEKATRSPNVYFFATHLFIKANDAASIISFNDRVGRTKKEVIQAINKAIKFGNQELKRT